MYRDLPEMFSEIHQILKVFAGFIPQLTTQIEKVIVVIVFLFGLMKH